MSGARNLRLLWAIALCVASAASVARAVVETVPLDRLRLAVLAHPEDADLAWAYARELASSDQIDLAIERTRLFIERWPERRSGARIEIARKFLEVDASARAIRLLDEELAENPQSPEARFYRGIALRSEGRLEEADREFQIAGNLQTTLRPETLLVRALGLFERGHEDEAVGLLKEILEIDPTGESAIRARLLLRQREILDLADRWRLAGYVGFEWDDNVTLESGEDEVLPSGRSDWRGIWGLGATWRAWIAERGSLTLGYRYDQTEHRELEQFNVIGNNLFASANMLWNDRLALRLDGVGYNTLEDLDNELTGGLVRPNLIVALGPGWGALRSFAQFEVSEYHDDPLFATWERDGFSYGFGLEHFLPLPISGSWLAFSGSWTRTLTQAAPGGGNDGFDGDFDYDSWRARGVTTLALPLEFSLQVEASYTHDRYHNDNLAYLIASSGQIRQRDDDSLNARVGISRPLFDHVEFEVYGRGTRRMSNLDFFDYDKTVIGAVLRFATD